MTPPDLKRCQAEHTNDDTFMTLGGRPGKMVRCESKPTVLATENKPGEDGEIGSMTLCTECFVQFVQRMPKDHASFKEIK